MDGLAELRNVWHQFAAGQIGPEGVVAAAQRACGAGVQRQAPSLAQLANLQPQEYGYVPQIFDRVRGELQAASASAAQSQQQVAYAVAGTAVAAPAMQQAAYGLPRQAAHGYPQQPAYGHPAAPPHGAPGAYPMQQGYLAPAPMPYPPAEPGLPPGVHGLTLKRYNELKRAGWICAILPWIILWPLGLAAVHNGIQLARAGESQGVAMAIAGGLASFVGLLVTGFSFAGFI